MLKNHKRGLICSSLVIVLPMLVGISLWDILPDRIPTHWGADGAVDGWSSPAVAVFGVPLMMLGFHWLSIALTALDPKSKNQNPKAFSMVLWICPVCSVFASAISYAFALGKQIDVVTATVLLLGLMFIFIGNYLPKCKQNSTIGLRNKWTMESEANWNATHRLAGKVWFFGGFAMLVCLFLPGKFVPWYFACLILVLIGIPLGYAWIFHHRHRVNETDIH